MMASGVVMAGHISTHSRAKAAGPPSPWRPPRRGHFNSQPREGGWWASAAHQARLPISTHSRAKAAGLMASGVVMAGHISTHSRAKAAGRLVTTIL